MKNTRIKLEYIPNIGFRIDSKFIPWQTNRIVVRDTIKLFFLELDENIELEDVNINKKSDLYDCLGSEENSLFLNYNANDNLNEVEIYGDLEIQINGLSIVLKKSINENLAELKRISPNFIFLEPGNYLFPDLKITIADNEYCGGKGNELAYFYAAYNIDHLII